MNTLIEKAIVVANIETGTLAFDLRPTDLYVVLEGIVRTLRPAAEAAGVTFLIDLPADLPLVLGDPRMLTLALQEVLDNAVKYGGTGPVRIDAAPLGRGVILAVCDAGAGIAAEDLPNLFHGLRRGAGNLNIGPHGLGLPGLRRPCRRFSAHRRTHTAGCSSSPGTRARVAMARSG